MKGGFLLWAVLAENFMDNHMGMATGVMKENSDFSILALGCLVQGFAFSDIFFATGDQKNTTLWMD